MIAWWTEIKLLLSLLLVVLIAYATIRILGRRPALSARTGPLQNVAVLPLAPGKTLQVVVLDERIVLVLGIAANVECVARFDDPDLAEKLLSGAGVPPVFFPRFLSRWRQKKGWFPEQSAFVDILRDRLGGGGVHRSGTENAPETPDDRSARRPRGVSEGEDE